MAEGLPLHGGARLAVDTTLVSAHHCDGTARPGAAHLDGAALVMAPRRKERAYPELVGPQSRAKLVVLAGEVGGRRSEETVTFWRLPTAARARSQSALLRRRAEQAWRMRWGWMLACSAARAFPASLLEQRSNVGGDDNPPLISDVQSEFRHAGLGRCGGVLSFSDLSLLSFSSEKRGCWKTEERHPRRTEIVSENAKPCSKITLSAVG